ncbi:hypothetical protein BVRB_5g112760 isoform A [Beta vulgaris subsp. vulgaris]|nr:hypothetical protein BVRB_5g112760 isoform A [Beta vulgaris subsp. vulgaris]
MGCKVTEQTIENNVTVTGSLDHQPPIDLSGRKRLHAIDVNMNTMPDLLGTCFLSLFMQMAPQPLETVCLTPFYEHNSLLVP